MTERLERIKEELRNVDRLWEVNLPFLQTENWLSSMRTRRRMKRHDEEVAARRDALRAAIESHPDPEAREIIRRAIG